MDDSLQFSVELCKAADKGAEGLDNNQILQFSVELCPTTTTLPPGLARTATYNSLLSYAGRASAQPRARRRAAYNSLLSYAIQHAVPVERRDVYLQFSVELCPDLPDEVLEYIKRAYNSLLSYAARRSLCCASALTRRYLQFSVELCIVVHHRRQYK